MQNIPSSNSDPLGALAAGALSGRTAVVTGGARGLGLAIAHHLSRAGADICLVDLLPGTEAAASLARQSGGAVVWHEADVTDADGLGRVFESVHQEVGLPDILVNCAGITSNAPLLEMSSAAWSRLFAVNVTGTMLVSQAFARQLIRHRKDETRYGAIVNVSSMSAFTVNVPQTQAAYNASKAAVSMLTRSAAIEWMPLGIRVNAIAPGYFESDMTRDFVAANPEMARDWISRIPAGRMGQPSELGPLVEFLVSDAAEYVVGQSFIIDGGYTVI